MEKIYPIIASTFILMTNSSTITSTFILIIFQTIAQDFYSLPKKSFRSHLIEKTRVRAFLRLISSYLILLVWLLSHILRTTLVLSSSKSMARLQIPKKNGTYILLAFQLFLKRCWNSLISTKCRS